MNRFRKKIIISFGAFVVILTGLLVYIAHSNNFISLSDTEEIKIAISVPLAGTAGASIKNSIELAFGEVNYTIDDFKVELLVLDGGDETGAWSDEIEKNNAETAAADPDVLAYMGTYNSGAAKISIPILNRANIVQISPANTWPGLTKTGFAPGEPGIFYPTGQRNYFRVCTTDDNQGPAGAIWANELGFSSVYVIDDGEAYGVGVAGLFKRKALSIGIDVVGNSTLSDEPRSRREILDKVKQHEPDLIYYGGTTPGGIAPFLQEIDALEIDVKIMGPDGIAGQDFIDLVGVDIAEGVYATTIGVSALNIDREEAYRFNELYSSTYGSDAGPFAVLAYESAQVLIAALKKVDGKKDRLAVLEAVRDTKNFHSLLDNWSFDDAGDTDLVLMSGSKVVGGAFVFIKDLQTPLTN